MNHLIKNVFTVLKTKPSNAFLLFLTGFLFAQVMIVNVLYTKHPQGGWATDLGIFTTPSILTSFLLALSLCLFVFWRSLSSEES